MRTSTPSNLNPSNRRECGARQVLVGAEPSELGADDLEELADDEDEYFRLGDAGEQFRDYAALALKGDHGNRRGSRALYSKFPEEQLLLRWCCICVFKATGARAAA